MRESTDCGKWYSTQYDGRPHRRGFSRRRTYNPPRAIESSEAPPLTPELGGFASASLGQHRFAPPPAGRENLTHLPGILGSQVFWLSGSFCGGRMRIALIAVVVSALLPA